MTLRLDAPTATDCESVRKWRNADRAGLRTPFFLTPEMQADFYRSVCCNRDSAHRYYAIRRDGDARSQLVAFGGLTNLEWENGRAEISLIVAPKWRGKGIGRASVDLLLAEGFGNMRLTSIRGEVYTCNPDYPFWKTVLEPKNFWAAVEPDTKFWNGQTFDSYHFSVRHGLGR